MPKQENTSLLKLRHLLPDYWGTWILLAFMRLSIYLPAPRQIFLGKHIGNILFFILPMRKRIACTNIKLCFPELEQNAIKKIAKESFQNAGISIFETAMAWWATDKQLQNRYQIEGLEHLQTALRTGQPVLLLSGHFSSTELGGRLLRLHYDFQAMYKPAKNKLYNACMWQSRSKHFAVVERKNSKQFIRQLKKGKLSWYAPDQNLSGEEHVFAPFFNVPTLTITATSRIANICKALVIPFSPIRENKNYKLILKPPLADFPSDDMNTDAQKVNKAIEDSILIDPSQYLWAHKRFHILPDGKRRKYQ